MGISRYGWEMVWVTCGKLDRVGDRMGILGTGILRTEWGRMENDRGREQGIGTEGTGMSREAEYGQEKETKNREKQDRLTGAEE